jgi:aminoglycoside phosphotransferase family enzyme
MRDNLRDLLAWSPQTAVSERLLALQAWTEDQFGQLAPLLKGRQQSGWVRGCHGVPGVLWTDMHAMWVRRQIQISITRRIA